MEKREEIKDGVKQRIIEFMAEQITNEESFASLKSELIEEFLLKKEIKPIVKVQTEPNVITDTFTKVAAVAEDNLQKIRDKQTDFFKKIIDVKLGSGSSENIKKMIRNLQDSDSTTYSDVIDQLSGKNIINYQEFFLDPLLKGDITEEKLSYSREAYMDTLKAILANPFEQGLDVKVNSHVNEKNYYKSYYVYDKTRDFKFECSYAYNDDLKNTYFDRFSADSKGYLLSGANLGVKFALDAIRIIDQAEAIRIKAIKALEKQNKRNAVTELNKEVKPLAKTSTVQRKKAK